MDPKEHKAKVEEATKKLEEAIKILASLKTSNSPQVIPKSEPTNTVQKAYLYYSKIITTSTNNALLLSSRDGMSQLWIPPSAIEQHDPVKKQIQVKDWFVQKIKWNLLTLPGKKTGPAVIIKEEE